MWTVLLTTLEWGWRTRDYIRKARRNHCQDVDHCLDEDNCEYHLGIDHCQDGNRCQNVDHCGDGDNCQYHLGIYHCQDGNRCRDRDPSQNGNEHADDQDQWSDQYK